MEIPKLNSSIRASLVDPRITNISAGSFKF